MKTRQEMESIAPPLDGVRVLEVSAFVAAPLAGATLAALGADVIRVDPPGGGIDIDRWPVHGDVSLYRAGLNQGKRSIELDLKSSAGRDRLVKLLRDSGPNGGILLTNLPVSGWNTFEQLSRVRSDLIMLVITGNRDGTPAVDYTVNAAIGFPMVTGPADHTRPVNHVMPAWDATTGLYAALGVLAAERHRRLTGEGQLIELSLSDVALAITGQLGLIAEATLNKDPRPRDGNYVFGTFGRDFATADGRHVVVVALTDRQWRSLTAATGLDAELDRLATKLRLDFSREGDRWHARAQICELIEPWVQKRSLAEIRRILDEHGVLWGPYQSFKQLLADDVRASTANSLFTEVDHAQLGRYLTPGTPLRFSRAGRVRARSTPTLGQDTADVEREFHLGDAGHLATGGES
jgi:2-methylfumaryl-CoA isomerase